MREDATAGCPWRWAEGENGGGVRVEGVRVEGWGGERRREEDLVRAFLFLLFDLTDCHTQSTPSLSLLPSLAESLCFHGNRLPCLPDNAPPLPSLTNTSTIPPPTLSSSIANAAIITVPQRHGESGQERGKT